MTSSLITVSTHRPVTLYPTCPCGQGEVPIEGVDPHTTHVRISDCLSCGDPHTVSAVATRAQRGETEYLVHLAPA